MKNRIKHLPLLALCICAVSHVTAQSRDDIRVRQAEQLQQIRQGISQKIDSSTTQLTMLGDSIEEVGRAADKLRRENAYQEKPDAPAGQTQQRTSLEMDTYLDKMVLLQKRRSQLLQALDKNLTLLKGLDEKINILVRDNYR